VHEQIRSVRDVVRHDHLVGFSVNNSEFTRTSKDHTLFLTIVVTLNKSNVFKLDTTAELRHHLRLSRNVGGRTTHVERTKCQLCTRLPDRLCSNYTNCFTQLYRLTAGKVTSVTQG